MGRHSNAARAPSQRQLRVGEHLRRRLAEIIADTPLGDDALDRVSVTVSEVKISPDLRHATVFVMPLGGQHAEEILQALRDRARPLRGQLGRGLHLRAVPDLRFELDESFEQADRMNRLLASVAPEHDEPDRDAPDHDAPDDEAR